MPSLPKATILILAIFTHLAAGASDSLPKHAAEAVIQALPWADRYQLKIGAGNSLGAPGIKVLEVNLDGLLRFSPIYVAEIRPNLMFVFYSPNEYQLSSEDFPNNDNEAELLKNIHTLATRFNDMISAASISITPLNIADYNLMLERFVFPRYRVRTLGSPTQIETVISSTPGAGWNISIHRGYEANSNQPIPTFWKIHIDDKGAIANWKPFSIIRKDR